MAHVFLAACVLALPGCQSAGSSGGSTKAPAGPAASSEANLIAAAQAKVEQDQVPSSLKPSFINYYASGPKDKVVYAMRAGLGALRAGRTDLAARVFDDAITEVERMQEGAAQAQRAKSKFVAEEEKWFKGENHERAALYFYRGITYLIAQDFGNAAACFKRSQLQDITGDDATDFAGDWNSSELALALATQLQGYPADAEAALKRAEKFHTRQGDVPPPTAETNTLVLVEIGEGPTKYRDGEHGEVLKFLDHPTGVKKIQVTLGAASTEAFPAESLYAQATTRGERKIDGILAGKARFKSTTDTLGNVGLVGGAAAMASGNDTAQMAGGIMMLGGLIAKGLAASTKAEADIRNWDNLPEQLFLVFLTMPTTEGLVKIESIGRDGSVKQSEELAVNRADKKLAVQLVRM